MKMIRQFESSCTLHESCPRCPGKAAQYVRFFHRVWPTDRISVSPTDRSQAVVLLGADVRLSLIFARIVVLTIISANCPADQLFLEAKKVYIDTLTKDGRKSALLFQTTSLSEILSIVGGMKLEYETKKQSSKARIWISHLSSRVNYYGAIMDVLVQHHPEYVSLAWGTMKLLFVVSGPYCCPSEPCLLTWRLWCSKSRYTRGDFEQSLLSDC